MLIPTNSKDLKGLREFLTQQRGQACSTASVFTGPLKAAMDKMVTEIDAWLAKLPTDECRDNWCLDNQLDSLFNLLTQASASASVAALELAKSTNGEQLAGLVTTEITKRIAAGELFTKESLPAATSAAITAQLAAGDLVNKERLTQLCSESKATGFSEGEASAAQKLAAIELENQTIAARKTLLQTASLPLPEAAVERAILGGSDEQFIARKTAFETRQAELVKDGIQLNSDAALANLWLDDAHYAGFKKLVTGLPQLKFNANPLAGTPGAPDKGGPPAMGFAV